MRCQMRWALLARRLEIGFQDGVDERNQRPECYLPGMETPERECWYINMGAVDRNDFTTDAMVRAANF